MEKHLSHIVLGLGVVLMLCISMRSSVTYWSFSWNQDYIAANLCEQKDQEVNSCNGHCVLNDQIDKEKKQDLPSSQQKVEVNIDMMIASTTPSFGECLDLPKLKSVAPSDKVRTPLLADIFHPPRVL